MTSRAGNRGFTLIELLVVLALIAMASSVVILSVSTALKKSVLKNEARRLYAGLKHAREMAIARHTAVKFEPTGESRGYSLTYGAETILARSLPGGISLSADTIVFYPLGDSTGGTITISDEYGRTYEISVSGITGKARIRRIQPS